MHVSYVYVGYDVGCKNCKWGEQALKLKKFRVTNFRSVSDSSWIEADDVTALVGTNESGKTNILLPLRKERK